VFTTTPTAAWGLLFTAMSSFLFEGCHLSSRTYVNGLVITDIQAPMSNIASMVFPLTHTYTLISVYCEVFFHSFVILIWFLLKPKAVSKAALYLEYSNSYPYVISAFY